MTDHLRRSADRSPVRRGELVTGATTFSADPDARRSCLANVSGGLSGNKRSTRTRRSF